MSRYPNYKYCPQKKTRKTRAYKKCAENEFSARDFENKQNLYALYQGKKKGNSTIDHQGNIHNLLYLIGVSKRRRSKDSCDSEPPSNCQKLNLDTTAALYPPFYSVSPASLQLSSSKGNHAAKINSTSYTTHQPIPLFPVTAYYGSPIASVTYSVPSQHFACSSSPVSTSDTSSSTTSDDTRTEPLVNYNIYNSYYASSPTSAEVVHSAYPYGMSGNVSTLHYVAPNHHYPPPPPPAAHYYTNAANSSIDYSGCLHPYDSKRHSHDVAAPPNLLTQPFYYQS